jgi:hypothetical protein
MANSNLAEARISKVDEFYTQFYDIENEINAYLDYNPNVFRDKVVLLPCDDPEWSNFTKYFAQNFESLGLKKLISTSFAPKSKQLQKPYQPSLFEQSNPGFELSKSETRGKLFILDRDVTGDGRIDIEDLQWSYLEGSGDFNSDEVRALRDESDFIITNPPFSLFRKFFAWIMESGKKFLLICNKNCISYKEVFGHFRDNQMWCGKTPMGADMLFSMPPEIEDLFINNEKEGSKYKIVNGRVMGRSASVWFTNIEHGRRHEPLQLMTKANNLRFSKHKELRGQLDYPHYDNFNAIDVPFVDAIPSDYDGIMGVPISFLGKYCPEQFKIIGITQSWDGQACRIYPEQIQVAKNGKRSRVTKLNDGAAIKVAEPPENEVYYIVGEELFTKAYVRILIQKL